MTKVNPNDENALRAALTKQPIAVRIEADQTMFSSYESGVLKASAGCGTKLDHAVLAVGFGMDSDGTKYWRIKVFCLCLPHSCSLAWFFAWLLVFVTCSFLPVYVSGYYNN